MAQPVGAWFCLMFSPSRPVSAGSLPGVPAVLAVAKSLLNAGQPAPHSPDLPKNGRMSGRGAGMAVGRGRCRAPLGWLGARVDGVWIPAFAGMTRECRNDEWAAGMTGEG